MATDVITPMQLFKGTRWGYKFYVTRWIDANGDLNLRDNKGRTALALAAYKKHCDIVVMLINAGADVDVQDENGWTALMYASFYTSREICELLIRAGANVNLIDKDGVSAVTFATHRDGDDSPILRMLINAGARLDVPVKDMTPIWCAINRGYIKNVELLLNGGVDVDSPCQMNNTPLISSILTRYFEITMFLVTYGADKHIAGNNGMSPIQLAEYMQDYVSLWTLA